MVEFVETRPLQSSGIPVEYEHPKNPSLQRSDITGGGSAYMFLDNEGELRNKLNLCVTDNLSQMKFKTLLTPTFDLRLFLLLSLSFAAFTIIGTLSHESGHYAMARHFGLRASIHYNYTDFQADPQESEILKEAWIKYPDRIKAHQPFPGKGRFDKINDQYIRARPWLTLGGPLQTMLTGTIGLILLILFRRRFFTSERLSFGLWLVVFITLFWLRQTTNLVSTLVSLVFRGSVRSYGDEFYLARHFHLPSFTILAITGLAGMAILLVVIFRFIPLRQRLTFISAGAAGGVAGFVFWLVVFGKMILP